MNEYEPDLPTSDACVHGSAVCEECAYEKGVKAERERCARYVESRLTAQDSLDGRRMRILADGIRKGRD